MLELMPGGPVIDPVAVLAAIGGDPGAGLTRAERLIAAAFILAAGGRQLDLRQRLGVSKAEACRIQARISQAVGIDRPAA